MDEKQILEEMAKAVRRLQDQLYILENRIDALEVHTGLYPYGYYSDEPEPGDLTEYHGDPDEE